MTINAAAGEREWNGRGFAFCSDLCLEPFDRAPERFAARHPSPS